MKSKLKYYNDGKCKEMSHEITALQETNNDGCFENYNTGYGETLPRAVVNFFDQVLRFGRYNDSLKRNIASSNIEIYNENEDEKPVEVDTEIRGDYYTGAKKEVPVSESLREMPGYHSDNYMNLVSVLYENIETNPWNTKQSTGYKLINELVKTLIKNFLSIPTPILIASQKTIQLQWRHPSNSNLLVICKFDDYGLIVSYIKSNGNTIDLSLEHDEIDGLIELLKLLDMYSI